MSELLCGSCKELQPKENFCKSSKRKTGYQYACKSCCAKASLERYYKKLAQNVVFKKAKAEYDKNRRQAQGDILRAYDKERSKRPGRKALHAEESRRRKLITKQQTPSWTDKDAIKSIYALAQKLSEITGQKYHVDHIYPLRGKNVCGLHVETNLRVLEASLNISKGNRENETS